MADMVTDDNFEAEVLKSDLPVMVDFFAQWCGPCKMMAPAIDELAGEYDGKWKIVKCDIDAAPNTAEKYGITSIPTLKYFKGGEVVDEMVGFKAKDDIKARLDA